MLELFRIWDPENKKMTYFDSDMPYYLGMDGQVYDKNTELVKGVLVMPYVGKKDMDRTRIYEGDILRGAGVTRMEVVWSQMMAGYMLQYRNGPNIGMKVPFNKLEEVMVVCGNIHEEII